MGNTMVLKIGETPLEKSIEMCGRCNGAIVYIKREDKNPFGTFKDRRCAALLEKYKDKRQIVFVQITNGNSGYSLGMLAQEKKDRSGQDIKVVNLISKNTPAVIKERLRKCSIIRELDISKNIITSDEMKTIAKEATGYNGPEENILNVEDYSLENGYSNIIKEIAASGIKPKYIFCPVGEGELLTELAAAAESVWEKNPPKLIGVTIEQNVLLSNKDFVKINRKNIADKLVNGYSKFKPIIKKFIEKGRVELIKVDESEIYKEYNYLNSIGISVEPSAAVAFCGAEKYNLKRDDIVVIVNTGKGIYNQKAIDRFWKKVLMSALKYVAVMFISAALMLGAFIYNKKQEEIKERIHWGFVSEASSIVRKLPYADENNDGIVSYTEEINTVCDFLYSSSSSSLNKCKSKDLLCLSDYELQFYIEFNGPSDFVMRETFGKAHISFLKGEWKPPYESKWKPSFCP